MKRKNIKFEIIVFMCIFLCAAVVVEMNILAVANKRQINRTSLLMLDQIDNIFDANDRTVQGIMEDLKVTYVERANTVAYILDNNKILKRKYSELQKLAEMMGIDEINLFDENGVIYGGTHPTYYGYHLDSGEQISYFKPMLEDKELTMVQDVTPNTVEAKRIMYAMVWDSEGTGMVQIGIEPIRLLSELRENSVQDVVSRMTVYEGMHIYVADVATGKILGSTNSSALGDTVYQVGILDKDDDLQKIQRKTAWINGFRSYCHFKQRGDMLIAVVHSTQANLESIITAIGIEVVWLLLAGSIILFVLLKLVNANEKIKKQMSLLTSISEIYYSMHLIDLEDLSIETFESNGLQDQVVSEGTNASDILERIIRTTVETEYVEAALEFAELSTLQQRLKDKKSISMDAVDKNVGWLRISFITVNADENQVPSKVLIATQVIDEDKKREEELAIKANRDEMTGLFNRRAYENDLLHYPDIPAEDNFVYAAIDINGLKVVNDEMGHVAGDELVKGAADCLKRTLGNYGRVYRTGGDEFVSMFFADEDRLQSIEEDLERTTREWTGVLVPELSLSVGYVAKREFEREKVLTLAKIADQRMYQVKAEYYSRKGVDRRGQAAAHKALCNLYTKILKINLTEDSYSIVNMDVSEQSPEKGFTDTISGWLYGFGVSGQVYREDLKEYLEKTDINYLREYFKQDKTSISIFYRRKYEDGYKQVVMEMIPADDYKEEDQSLFLYIKTIDK